VYGFRYGLNGEGYFYGEPKGEDNVSTKITDGLADIAKSSGISAMVSEIHKRIEEKKEELLMAWYAEHGFAPGNAVLVCETTFNGPKFYIREATKDELSMADSAVRESAPRWIPVEERLPEDGAACVVWALGDYRIADYSIIPGKWSIMDWDCTHEEIAVTHWMPLPDAPKEGE